MFKADFRRFCLITISIFFAAISLTGCQDLKGTNEYIVFDGLGKDVEFLVTTDSVSPVRLEPLTVVEILGDYNTGGEYMPFSAKDSIHGYIAKSKLHERHVFYEQKGSTLQREPFFYEKLSLSGSTLSGKLFGYVEQLHFYMYEYNTVLWAILFIIGAIVTGLLLFPIIDEGEYFGKYYGLIPTAAYLFTLYCAFILFIVQDWYNLSAHTGWGWFADLIIFLGILGAGIGVYLEFNPTMQSLVPSVPVVRVDTVVISILTVVYGICLWLAKGTADIILWGLIIVQCGFSLFIIIMSIRRGEIVGALIYALVYPLCYAVILTTLITLGFMVFCIAIGCVACGSLLTQPQGYGASDSASSAPDMISDPNGNHHYVASENADGTVTTTDGHRMRRRPDNNWEDL